jgi:methionyl-tRNA formyltransferase
MKSNISLLLSGNLGYKLLIYLYKFCTINFIAADKKSVKIITFAKINQIPLYIGNPRNNKLSFFIKNVNCDILLSINYLFIIEEDIINKFKYPINFHGSLLPKFRGRTPHVWAIINNETETGITAHFIDKGCDTGDIILQKRIPITKNDTGASMLDKFVKNYPLIVREVIEKIQTKKLKRIKQDNSLATFFEKRTPKDGRIDWNWQKERIRNWVRAQAYPYPGAFTFYKDNKITIDRVSYSNYGFMQSTPNGTILQGEPDVIIKTPNGAIQLDTIREKGITFLKSNLLK